MFEEGKEVEDGELLLMVMFLSLYTTFDDDDGGVFFFFLFFFFADAELNVFLNQKVDNMFECNFDTEI